MGRPRRQAPAHGTGAGSRSRPVPTAAAAPTAPAERILDLQRQAGNAAVSRALQPVTVDVGFGVAENNGQLLAAGRFMVAQLREDLADLAGGGAARTHAEHLIAQLTFWLPALETRVHQPIDATVAAYAEMKIREYGEVRLALHRERVAPLREALREARREADRAAEQADALAGRMDDLLRAAFRSGSSNAVKDVVGAVKSTISIGRAIRALAEGIGRELLGLDIPTTKTVLRMPHSRLMPPRFEVVSVSKYTDMLTRLGKGLATVSIALTVADRSRRATELDQGMKDLGDAVGIASDVGTLLGTPPHMSLMSTLYIKPMVQVITVLMGQIGRQLSDENRGWVELTGELGRPDVEPGGQPMFDFMRQVMHAGGEAEVPPVTGPVREYLYDHRDRFAAGAEADLPTAGWWLWKDLDPARAAGWVFAHRHRVWAMLYGSMPVPPPR